jgi:hypothetical protein
MSNLGKERQAHWDIKLVREQEKNGLIHRRKYLARRPKREIG